ncbi:MAG: PEP/pyruvate-binding domain-containing protein [bacterium]
MKCCQKLKSICVLLVIFSLVCPSNLFPLNKLAPAGTNEFGDSLSLDAVEKLSLSPVQKQRFEKIYGLSYETLSASAQRTAAQLQKLFDRIADCALWRNITKDRSEKLNNIIELNMDDPINFKIALLESGLFDPHKSLNNLSLSILVELLSVGEINNTVKAKAFEIADKIMKSDKSVVSRVRGAEVMGYLGEYGVKHLLNLVSPQEEQDIRNAAMSSMIKEEVLPHAIKMLLRSLIDTEDESFRDYVAFVLDNITSLNREYIRSLYGENGESAAEKLAVEIFSKSKFPTFIDFISSPFFGVNLTKEKAYILESNLTKLMDFRASVSEGIFNKLMLGYGFPSVCNWMEMKEARAIYFLADLVIDGKEVEISRAFRKVLESNDSKLTQEVVMLLLARQEKLDTKLIKDFLSLISENPSKNRQVIAFLIVALKLKRIVISENAFIQEWISNLLNSDINDVYYLANMLIRSIPYSYDRTPAFPEKIREYSRLIDEVYGQGKFFFFSYIRFKMHRNPSSEDREFIASIISGIKDNNPEGIRYFVKEVQKKSVALGDLEPYLNNAFIQPFHKIINEISSIYSNEIGAQIDDPTLIPLERIDEICLKLTEGNTKEREIVKNLLKLYKYLVMRYPDINSMKSFLSKDALSESVVEYLKSENYFEAVKEIESIRRETKRKLLKKVKLQPIKDTYIKRHVAPEKWGFLDFGSYTRYSEAKFEAFNRDIELEMHEDHILDLLFIGRYSRAVKFIQDEASSKGERKNPLSKDVQVNLGFIIDCVKAILDKIELQGLAPRRLMEIKTLLDTQTLTLSQLRDILSRLMEEHVRFINFFNYTYGSIPYQLSRNIKRSEFNNAYKDLRTETELNKDQYCNYIQEVFVGNLLAENAVIELFERYVQSANEAVEICLDVFEDGVVLRGEDSDVLVVDHKKADDDYSPAIMGGKAYSLLQYSRLNMPVPEWSCFTTNVFKEKDLWKLDGARHDEFKEMVVDAVLAIEKTSKKAFPFNFNTLDAKLRQKIIRTREEHNIDTREILLISVRSGSYISLPGILDTVINVPMNDEILAKIIESSTNELFAYDLYRSFLATYAEAVFGIEKQRFSDLIDSLKSKIAAKMNLKKEDININEFNKENMIELIELFKNEFAEKRINLKEKFKDPFQVLLECIESVFNSWDNSINDEYRALYGYSHNWKTACTLEKMVFGNLNRDSGTGVAFTRDPVTGALVPIGDYKFCAQGTDIVGGISIHSMLISRAQIGGDSSVRVLEDINPGRFKQISDIAEQVDAFEGEPFEIELTTEARDETITYLLQARPVPITIQSTVCKLHINDEVPVANGVAVCGSGVVGRVLDASQTGLKDLTQKVDILRKQMDEAGEDALKIIILFKYITPENALKIAMPNVDGILSMAVTSGHASLAAIREGKTYIGAVKNIFYDDSLNKWLIEDKLLEEGINGDIISVDGQQPSQSITSGNIYRGAVNFEVVQCRGFELIVQQKTNFDSPAKAAADKLFDYRDEILKSH